jgi:hypothetical protein
MVDGALLQAVNLDDLPALQRMAASAQARLAMGRKVMRYASLYIFYAESLRNCTAPAVRDWRYIFTAHGYMLGAAARGAGARRRSEGGRGAPRVVSACHASEAGS